MRGPVKFSRAVIRQNLINAGYSPEQVHEMLQGLPEPLDLQHHTDVLEKLGIRPEQLMDDLGDSP